jgi:hypothetical protein
MTDRNGTPSDASESSPDRDPLDVTDLPDSEPDDSEVKGGTGLQVGIAPNKSIACMAPASSGCLPSTTGCPPSSNLCSY